MRPSNISILIMAGLLCFFAGCERDEVVLTGEITGYLKVYDENSYSISEKDKFEITLKNDSLTESCITDDAGWFSFKNIPNGNYSAEVKKDGFIQDEKKVVIHHIGGYSPTFKAITMHRIPQFQISIDSIIVEPTYGERLWAYSHISNYTDLPKIQYEVMVYFNDTENVSKDDYLFYHYGSILPRNILGDQCIMWVSMWDYNFLYPDGYDSLYVRGYPRANYLDWFTLREEAFGTPSEVFKWKINK